MTVSLTDKNPPAQNWKAFWKSPVFWLLFIALVFRGFIDPQGFLDPKRHGKPNAESPDVPSYLEAPNLASVIGLGKVNTERTPVYPLFIDIHRRLPGENHQGEEHLYAWLVFSQRMISLISVFFFYRVAEHFIRRKWLAVTSTLAYIGIVSFLLFNNWILSESLSVSGIVIWFYCLVTYFQKPSLLKAFFVGFGVFLLIMLRPAFLGLLLLVFIFWAIRLLFQRDHFKSDMVGLISTIVTLALVLGYSHQVWQKTGIFNVTVLGASNQYICVLQSGLFQKDDSPVGLRMQTALKEYLEMFPDKAGDPLLLSRPRVWTYPADPINFISNSARNDGLLPTIKDRSDYAKSLIKTHKVAYAGFVLGKFLRQKIFYAVYALILLEAVLILVFWKSSGKMPLLLCVFWLMITGLLFTAIAGAQDEYLRLSLPILPFVIVIPFQFLDVVLGKPAFE
ncbi:MAG: hypothetical protein FWC50_08100 [Planctomycetaceae bacterium]|nr:hypothetical protein [Planctomycetaceae bacterium]